MSKERLLITYKKLTSIPVVLWLLITSYALGVNRYAEGLVVVGVLTITAFAIPFLFDEREPYYDALLISPMFIGYVLMIYIAYSEAPVHLTMLSSLYMTLTTLLSAIIPLAWNISSKLRLNDLIPQILTLYFLTFSTSYLKPLNLYSNLFILSLALTFIRSFKSLLSTLIVLSLTFLPFLGIPYMITEFSVVPYINLGMVEVSADVYGYAILITYLTLLICFILVGYISTLILRKFKHPYNIYDVLWNTALFLTPPLVFTFLCFIISSNTTQLFELRYLHLNLLLIALLTIPNSLFKSYLDVRNTLMKSTEELRNRCRGLQARIEYLEKVLSKMRSSNIWSEELNPLNERLTTLLKELELVSNTLKKTMLKSYEVTNVSEKLDLIEGNIPLIEESIVSMCNEVIKLALRTKVILTHSLISRRFIESYPLELNEVSNVRQVEEIIEKLTPYLSSICDNAYELLEYSKHLISEALGISMTNLNIMKCGEYLSKVKALENILNTYVKVSNIASDDIIKMYNNLLKTKNIVADLAKASETLGREELFTVKIILEINEILKELPETLDRTALIASLSSLITLTERLTEAVIKIPENLEADLESILEYLNKNLPNKTDVIKTITQRYKRKIHGFVLKLSLETLKTAENYVVKSYALLKTLEENTQTLTTLVRDLTYLRSLAYITPLLLDYIDYKLRSKGSIDISELPFKAEVTAWILRIITSLREDVEVTEDKLKLKR